MFSLIPKKIDGRNLILRRPYETFPDILLCYLKKLNEINRFPGGDLIKSEFVFTSRADKWDNFHVAPGATPIETEYGWLHFYMGTQLEKGKRVYKLGLILLDINDPSVVLYRSESPLLSPKMKWEKEGLVNNVIYVCGAVARDKDTNEVLDGDDTILVYYGAADTGTGVAAAKLSELIPIKEIESLIQKRKKEGDERDKNRKLGRVIANNPVVEPRPEAEIQVDGQGIKWEKYVLNAAAIRINGVTYLFYRAVGKDEISRIGLWCSRDGINEDKRLPYPVFLPKGQLEICGVEDPRIHLIDDTLYMAYTAYDGNRPRAALAYIKVDDFLSLVENSNSSSDWDSKWIRQGLVFPLAERPDDKCVSLVEREEKKAVAAKPDRINLPQALLGKVDLIHRTDGLNLDWIPSPFADDIGKPFLRLRPGNKTP